MKSLLQRVLEAHGGLKRWQEFKTVSAHLQQAGALWALKGKAGVLDDVTVTADLVKQWASHAPFGGLDRKSAFTTTRIAIENQDGAVLEELVNPRASFAGHKLETPWTDLQLAFFAGCAMWTYLNVPFVLARPDIYSEDLSAWEENGQTWQRLRVRFPEGLEVFSKQQTFYFNKENLLARMDYDVEIAGGAEGAHYVSEFTEVSGIAFPTKRRIYPRLPDNHAASEPVIISIDLDHITLR
jgi:hypothetical protein